nr:magnetosome protein Mad23-2 [Desulfobacteraceae bacterium]
MMNYQYKGGDIMKKIQSTQPKRTGISGFMVKVLNESGTALVAIYDGVSYSVSKVKEGVRKSPEVSEKVTRKLSTNAKTYVNENVLKRIKHNKKRTLRNVKNAEAKQLSEKIKNRKRKIASLYYEIGKEGSKHADNVNPLETETIQKLISDIRGYEDEIHRLQERISKLEQQKIQTPEIKKEMQKDPVSARLNKDKVAKARAAKAKFEKEKQKASIKTVKNTPESSIQIAIKVAIANAKFSTPSERLKFDKVAHDLFDKENEIRMLAASELAKIGNVAAVPILLEVVKFNDPYLTSEIINSLINLGDHRAIPLFKEKIKDSHYRVRVAALRGLYKLLDDDSLISYLSQAIRDDHPEVRKSAVTFFGWKDYSDGVPPLVQCLNDEDERVKKASISALANIRDKAAVLPLINRLNDNSLDIRQKSLAAIQTIVGEDISFDIHQSDETLPEAIQNLKVWWQEKRIRLVQDTDSDFDHPYNDAFTDEIHIDAPVSKFGTTHQDIRINQLQHQPMSKSETIAGTIPDTKTNKHDTEPQKQTIQSQLDIKTPSHPSKDDQKEIQKESSSLPTEIENKPINEDKNGSINLNARKTNESGNSIINKTELTKENLKKLSKPDLINLGREIGVESDESITKNKIIRNILDNKA